MYNLVCFMLWVSVVFVCLIIAILIFDIVRLIQRLVNGPYLSKYTEPISVKCTDLIEVKVTKSVRRYVGSRQRSYTDRQTAWIMRPSFSGFYNGENLTFCRRKDWQQPKAEVGKHYTIYVQPGIVDCHDYYEEQEKNFLQNKRQKQLLVSNFSILLMILWMLATYCLSLKVNFI